MRVFKLVLEVCVAGIQRYGYQYNYKIDETESLKIVQEPNNKFDTQPQAERARRQNNVTFRCQKHLSEC